MNKNATQQAREKAGQADPERIAALAAFRHEVIRYLNVSKEAAESEGITAIQYQALCSSKD